MVIRIFGVIALIASFADSGALTLTSSAFTAGGVIPNQFTFSAGSQCNGNNWSPPLAFGDVPTGTSTFSIRVVDPDGGNWVHWSASGIPGATRTLDYNASATATFTQARNDFGTIGWGGPCPPTPNHHYVFTLSALDASGSVLQTATLTGIRSPSDNVTWTPPTPTPTPTPTVDKYSFSGFYPPLSNPALNSVKKGAIVKVAFKLTDATGALVTSPASVASTSYNIIDCNTLQTTSDINPGRFIATPVKWNKSTKRLEFRWTTPKTAGTCVKLNMILDGGQIESANIFLKK